MRNRTSREERRLLAGRQGLGIAEGMMFRIVLLLTVAAIFSSCTSPDSDSFMSSGKDARVFNPVTGRYEWP